MKLKHWYNKPYTFWILNTCGWLAYFFYNLYIMHHNKLREGIPLVLLRIFLLYMFGFPLSLMLRALYNKIKHQAYSVFSLSAIVVPASIVGAVAWFGFEKILIVVFGHFQSGILPASFHFSFWNILGWGLVLIAWSILYFLIKFWISLDQQLERTATAQIQAHDIQSQMLQSQLNKHFLFNSLNSIRSLVDENVDQAKEMVTELSDFLRYFMVSRDHTLIPLKDELEAIRNYLNIEKKRFEEKLDISIISDPLAEDFLVPGLLIHPLVENAIKYGMKTSPLPLAIRIRTALEDGKLRIEVFNTGKWIQPDVADKKIIAGTGTGLENVRLRLANAFPDKHHLEIEEKEDGVHISLLIKQELGSRDKN
jgi:two-component system, LytTR family, sensor kinase